MRLRSYRLAGVIALVIALGVNGMASISAQEASAEIGLLTCGLTRSEDVPSGPGGAAPRQTRDLLCAFRPAGSGPEETYTGTLQGVGPDTEFSDHSVMIWIVKGRRGTAGSPGLLQQVYAAELAANPGQSPPLIGETNTSLVLRTLADELAPAGASTVQQAAIATVVLITLRLKSTPA